MKLLGIFRETLHSPLREFDDYEILRLTAQYLVQKKIDVHVAKPEEFLALAEQWTGPLPDGIFMMCEQEKILNLLHVWEQKGVKMINSIHGIWNTYRYNMVPLIQKAEVSHPESHLVFTQDPVPLISKKVWIKRGDVHNTQKGDVSLVESTLQVQDLFNSFLSRGISQAVIQDHIQGDLIKFYGVGSRLLPWFRWFYHKDQELKNYKFSTDQLRDLVFHAAETLNLQVFGGDVVVDPQGNLFLIDMNAWPSFALFRSEAAPAIAEFIALQVQTAV